MTARDTRLPSRVPTLDALRFVAASAVTVYHFTAAPVVDGAVRTDTFGVLGHLARFGYLGVELFFLISGFVIVMSAQGRTGRAFLVNRAIRLYPSFWVAVAVTSAALWWADRPQAPSWFEFVANLSMLPGYLGAEKIDDVYWTLAVELKFYFLVFVALQLRLIDRVEWLALGWLALLALAETGVGGGAIRSIAIVPHGSFFVAGTLCFIGMRDGWRAHRVAALLGALVLSVRAALAARGEFLPVISPADAYVVTAIILGAYGAMVMAPRVRLPEGLAQRLLRLGALTYPLYLLHSRIGRLLFAALQPRLGPWTALLIESVVITGAAWLLAELVERRGVPWLARSAGLRRLAGTSPR